MSFIFSRYCRQLKKCLSTGANIRLPEICSNESLATRHFVSPFSTYYETVHRLSQTVKHFAPKEPKISYLYSEPVQLYKEQEQCGTVDDSVTFLVVDLGTTGLNSTRDQITEIAIRDLKGGENSMFHMLLSPDKTPKNHKTSRIMTASSVRRCELISLPKWIKIRRKDSRLVIMVAHNGDRFDFPFLVRAFSQNGLDIPEDMLFLDSLPITRQLHHPDGTKLRKGNHNLNSIVTFLGVPVLASKHKSVADVNALSSVLQQLTFCLRLTETDLIDRAYKPSRYSIVRPRDRSTNDLMIISN